VLLERVLRDAEAVDELARRDLGGAFVAALRQEVREQRLEHGETLGHYGPGGPVTRAVLDGDGRLARDPRQRAFVCGANLAHGVRDLAPELVRLERDRATVLSQDPRGEQWDRRVRRDEHSVLDAADLPVRSLDPPGGVPDDLDPCLADDVTDLPRRLTAIVVDVEVGRDPEVALAARGESDVAADPGDAERAHVLAIEVLGHHVPDAVVVQEGVRIDGPLRGLVPPDRPVVELDRPLLRDRPLELSEPTRHLRRVVGIEHLHPHRGGRVRLGEPGSTEREVLQSEPQRLGVRELSLQQVEAGLQRRELLVGELERRQEVLLRAQRVELLARELVALGVQGHAERHQLGAVGVEAPSEGLVGHLRVALDVLLDVACSDRPPFRHQVGDERELADQLVGVVRHVRANLSDALRAETTKASSLHEKRVPRGRDCSRHTGACPRAASRRRSARPNSGGRRGGRAARGGR